MKTKIFLTIASLFLLASCKAVSNWFDSLPADPAIPPMEPLPPGSELPIWGGDGIFDIIVTLLSFLGLAPAARVVMMAKPVLAPIVRSILGKKQPVEEPKKTLPPVS